MYCYNCNALLTSALLEVILMPYTYSEPSNQISVVTEDDTSTCDINVRFVLSQ